MVKRSVEIPASVSLDGDILKQIREEKRLTQLYVSKVVGVTTDTISRWENNRYPSIRRENALKLAEALEVGVEELLRKPPVETASAPPPPTNWWPMAIGGLLAGIAVVALLMVVYYQSARQLPPASITAVRVLPQFAAPGASLPVQLKLTERSEESGFILREYLPKGWKLLQSNPPASSLDNDNGMVRWIVKAGDPRERIVYLVQVDRNALRGSEGVFQGEVVVGSGSVQSAMPVQGESRVAVAPVLWADANGDGRIDDGEMLQASYVVDEMSGVHIDWIELERLWNAGGYRWDENAGRFLPVRPLNQAPTP